MRLMMAIIFINPLSMHSCIDNGDTFKYAKSPYESYEVFNDSWNNAAIYLPKNSLEIHHYPVLDFDTNYHFIEATAELKSLKAFVLSENYFNCEHHGSGISYSDQVFDELFYKRPDWWNEKSFLGFEESYIFIFADKNNYGRGCWLFYDSDKQKIRLFTWSQQWLSEKDVRRAIRYDR